MINTEQDHELLHAEGDAARRPRECRREPVLCRENGIGPETGGRVLLAVVLVPPLAGFYSYFTGIPLHLLTAKKEDNELKNRSPAQYFAGRGSSSHAGTCLTRSRTRWESVRATMT